ncbi:MAG: PilN domain-containing protein [Pseudomonadales bacterium]|nr:PilN domain-containing protein [Pseudomonadales bacterium]
MTKINLLPWREELRKKKRQEFFTILAGTVIVGALLIFLGNSIIAGNISHQNGRNQYLTTEIKKLDEKIEAIKDLQSRRNQLVERMKVIQNLQGNRPVIVHLLDELTRTVPDGVYYTKATRTGNKLTLEGIAETNNKISKLMRNLDDSSWFSNPNLSRVNNKEVDGKATNAFVLSVNQVLPKVKKEEAE